RPARFVLTAAATWTVLGGTSLARHAAEIAVAVQADDLVTARRLLPQLVGRDPSVLDADGIAGAVVESVAENTSDAVVGALFWGALAGIPGLLGYRAANTLDAMVGHHTERYQRFGTAAARLDDLANLLPARLTGLLVAGCAPLVGGSPVAALAAWRRDAAAHPSPNAGVCEAAFAGALGVQLGGQTVYAHRTEQRPVLGAGRRPEAADVARAVRLSRAVCYSAAALATASSLLLGQAAVGAGARVLRRARR
ncbi:MAG: adenosylcobinamide-phosphate synthase CbiB, partial [Jatrophihabitans sp.]